MAPDRALVRIGDLVHRVVTFEDNYRIGGTRCTLHFVALRNDDSVPVWVTNQLTGRFAWKMFDVATCLWCVG
jgi:hypothetical protein